MQNEKEKKDQTYDLDAKLLIFVFLVIQPEGPKMVRPQNEKEQKF